MLLAFAVDRDGDGVHDDGEEFAVTSDTGTASITPNSAVSATDKLVITSITLGQTIGGTTYTTGTVEVLTLVGLLQSCFKAPSFYCCNTCYHSCCRNRSVRNCR